MITLDRIAEELQLEVISCEGLLRRPVVGGYASDLLSCVMARAKHNFLWVTLQSHVNVVAVASLLGLAGVIITEGNKPDQDTVARAEKEDVVLMLTPSTTFSVVGRLASLGVRGEAEHS